MGNITRKNYPVSGMGCAACVARVQKALQQSAGVHAAEVSLASNSARIDYDPSVTSPAQLRQCVQDAGYDLIVPEDDDDSDPALSEEAQLEERAEEEQRRSFKALKRDTVLALILAAAVMILGMAVRDFPGKGWLMAVLSGVSVCWCGRRFFKTAFKQARTLHAGMDTLVALSVGMSFLFSLFNLLFPKVWTSRGLSAGLYFESSAMIVAFILAGRLLEDRAKHRTTQSVRALIQLQPQRRDVRKGQAVDVLPGESIPADGTVIDGFSYIDESMLTGEPLAAYKEAGSHVYAGTINGNNAFRMIAEKVGNETTLSSIIRMVQDAQGSKTRIQRTVDKICAWFVPAVLAIALLSLLGWTLLTPDGFIRGLLAMVTVLVVACPCSLGLATPTALTAGIGRGASAGILIKDADSLQVAADIDVVVLDKTGTLTTGKPSVSKLEWFSDAPHLPSLLKTIEMRSGHPLGDAIVTALASEPELDGVSDCTALPGQGVTAQWNNQSYYVSNFAPSSPCHSERSEESTPYTHWRQDGSTVVFFHDGQNLLAAIAISDQLKPDSAKAVQDLKDLGIEVHMLTGDHQDSAQAVARNAGIDHVCASAMPNLKVEYIKQLQKDGHKVAMAGDGINDSAALMTADLGIAMGKGSDIAINSAMTTIVSSSLSKIPELTALSRRTLKIIRQNLVWAFLYNIIAIPVASGVLSGVLGFALNPMVAAAAMACSSVIVVTNSLRLLINHK
ncbi:MAG: copper-translocating P-type ATPase [Bacteroidales bacterium]|nr:copper-translocating P-type ATPase [Bacteroidales bacterium]